MTRKEDKLAWYLRLYERGVSSFSDYWRNVLSVVAPESAQYKTLAEWSRTKPGSIIGHGIDCTPDDMSEPDEEGIRDCLRCGLWEVGYAPRKRS